MIKENYFSKKLSCGDILDYSTELFRGDLKAFTIMSLIFHVPVMTFCYALMSPSMMYNTIMSDYSDDNMLSVMLITMILMYLGIGILALYQSTIYLAYVGGVTKFAYEKTVNGETMKVGKALKFGFRKMGWLILYNFLVSTVVEIIIMILYFGFFGLMLLFAFSPTATGALDALADGSAGVWGDIAGVGIVVLIILAIIAIIVAFLYFSVRLSLVTPAIVVDNCNCFTAVKRSFQLTKKRVFKTFWTSALGSYVISLASSALTTIASLFMFFQGDLVSRIFYGVSGGVSAIVTPLSVIIPVIIFINAKKQNGDIDFEQRIKEEV